MNKYRSLLFTPGHKISFFKKLKKNNADCIIFDLEDSVPENKKDLATNNINSYLKSGNLKERDVFIRINKKNYKDDILNIPNFLITGLVLPKINDLNELNDILEFIRSKSEISSNLKLILVIETPKGIKNLYNIVDKKISKEIIGIGFGGEDYISLINGTRNKDLLLYPRNKIVVTAKTYDLACYDTVFLNYNNLGCYKKEADYIKNLGFDGKFLIHPKQISITNEIFGFTEEEINEMKLIVKKFYDNNEEILEFKDKLFEKPHIKRYENILNLI